MSKDASYRSAPRRLYIKTAGEPARGPLEEADVRAAFTSGVLPPDALAGTRADDLRPIAQVLQELQATPDLAPAPGRGRAVRIAIALAVFAFAAGLALAVTMWIRSRPPPLCKATPHILARLKTSVSIRVYATRRVKKIDQRARAVEGLLRQMKDANPEKIDFQIVDVNDEVTAKIAQEAGLQQLPYASGDKSSSGGGVENGYFGVAFAYLAEHDHISLLSLEDDVQTTEFWLTNKLREISARGDGVKRKLGVLTGHHEIALSDKHLVPNAQVSVQGVIAQYFPFYQIVDVQAREREIDSELDGLIVTTPTDDLTDEELKRIDRFLMLGKSLAVIASAALPKLSDPRMTVHLSTHGLEKLTGGYGLELGRDLVFDEQQAYHVKVNRADGSLGDLAWSYLVRVGESDGLDSASPLFFHVPEAAFPTSSSITKNEDRQRGARFRVYARTSTSAIRDTRPSIELTPLNPAKGTGPTGEVILAASVEGMLTSAFGTEKSAKPARVLVISSSQFFTNPFVRAAAGPDLGQMGSMIPTADESLAQFAGPYVQLVSTSIILIVKNLLDWLAFDDDMAVCLPQKKLDAKDRKPPQHGSAQ